MHNHNGHIYRCKLESAHPTQITAGYYEVALKRQAWRVMKKQDREKYLDDHCVPAILGHEGEHYIVDHHHLCLALLEEGVKHVWIAQLADFSALFSRGVLGGYGPSSLGASL